MKERNSQTVQLWSMPDIFNNLISFWPASNCFIQIRHVHWQATTVSVYRLWLKTNAAYRRNTAQWRINKEIVEVSIGTFIFTLVVDGHLIFSEHIIRLFVRIRHQLYLSQMHHKNVTSTVCTSLSGESTRNRVYCRSFGLLGGSSCILVWYLW